MDRPNRLRSTAYGLVAIGLLLMVMVAAQGARRTTAAPTALAGACEWQRLARGDERSNHVLVPVPGVGVLSYGGIRNDRGNGDVKDDVAMLDLTVASADGLWETVAATGSSPGKRGEHMAVTRGVEGHPQVVTYGGIDTVASGNPGGTFTWRSPLTAGGQADGRLGALAPEAVLKNGAVLTLNGAAGSWTPLPSDVGPLTDASAVYWPEGDSMILFGGRTGTENRNAVNRLNVLALDSSPVKWTSADLTGAPIARWAHSAVYDAAKQRMIVFGGTTDWKTGRNDVWSLDLSTGWATAKWQEVKPTGRAPGRRFDHAAVYLPGLRWMVVFGGTRNGSDVLDDVAALDLSVDPPAWTPLSPTGTAPPGLAYLAGSATDAKGGDMAVFYGGEVSGSSKREAWGLSCTGGAGPTATTPPTVPPTVVPTDQAPTETPTSEATAVATATPPGATDLTVSGRVTAAAGGGPIAGAVVAVGVTVPHQPFPGTTDADGRYSLLVPAQYVPMIDRITVDAAGYAPMTMAVTAAQLISQPVRDFSLTALPTPTPAPPTAAPGGKIYLPVTYRLVTAR